MSSFEDKKSVLLATISDLSGNLKLIDTKVSIIVAATGIILGGLISCRSNLLKAYNHFETIPAYKWLFLIISLIILLTVLTVLVSAFITVMPRIAKGKRPSIWFFDINNLSEDAYKNKIRKYSDDDFVNSLASEVYKLNDINRKKIKHSQIAVISFLVLFCAFLSIMIMVGLSYIGVL